MKNGLAGPRLAYSPDRPYRVHVENARSLQPVFIVFQEQYEEALRRHADLAPIVRTTIGFDFESYKSSMAEADALIGYDFPKRTLAQDAPNLKLIQVLGAGVDYLLPIDWLPPHVSLTTNSGAHVPKAAQSALMALLMLNARMPALVTSQARREWSRIFTSTLEGKTLLIVGVGHIGGGVADHAKQFGMHVLGIRREAVAHPSVDEMHGPEDLYDLLPRADFVLLNLALTPETRFVMGHSEFRRMKRGAAFVNMSRGGLVDLSALAYSLRDGHLSGAIVDVTFPEPLPAESPIWKTPNLIITPHVLSDDIEQYVPRTLDIFFENVRRQLAGQPLVNVVSPERGY